MHFVDQDSELLHCLRVVITGRTCDTMDVQQTGVCSPSKAHFAYERVTEESSGNSDLMVNLPASASQVKANGLLQWPEELELETPGLTVK